MNRSVIFTLVTPLLVAVAAPALSTDPEAGQEVDSLEFTGEPAVECDPRRQQAPRNPVEFPLRESASPAEIHAYLAARGARPMACFEAGRFLAAVRRRERAALLPAVAFVDPSSRNMRVVYFTPDEHRLYGFAIREITRGRIPAGTHVLAVRVGSGD